MLPQLSRKGKKIFRKNGEKYPKKTLHKR